MNHYVQTLDARLDCSGYRKEKIPFHVELDASAIARLIEDAEHAQRVYELFSIRRPGDIWKYVWLRLIELPRRMQARYEEARKKLDSRHGAPHPWPESAIPYQAFDAFFEGYWEDTDPEESCWLMARRGAAFRQFAVGCLVQVREAQGRLRWAHDPLIRHEISQIDSGEHLYEHRTSTPFQITRRDEPPPARQEFDAGYYKKLKELLLLPEIRSVACRSLGDYETVRLFCTEQRERADRCRQPPGRALVINIIADRVIDTDAWDAHVRWHSEGLGYGDLFVEHGFGGYSIKELVEEHHRISSPFILTTRETGEAIGEIEGYSREAGDGWVLYRTLHPKEPRRYLTRTFWEMLPSSMCVLKAIVDGCDVQVFSHERIVVLIGADGRDAPELYRAVADIARACESLTVVTADPGDGYERAGCRSVIHLPFGGLDLDSLVLPSSFIRYTSDSTFNAQQVTDDCEVLLILGNAGFSPEVGVSVQKAAERGAYVVAVSNPLRIAGEKASIVIRLDPCEFISRALVCRDAR